MAHTPCEPAQNQVMMVNKRCHGSENMSHGKKTLPRQRFKNSVPLLHKLRAGVPMGAKTLGYSREEGSFLVGVRNTGAFS